MKTIPLGISVNKWNTLKFGVLELFVSLVFASTWNMFLGRASARALRNSAGVCLVPSGFVRFTPAEVSFYTTQRPTTRTPNEDAERREQYRRTRVVIEAVNLLLFGLPFVLEYGSTDLPNFERRRVAVVTMQSIRDHSRRTALRAGTIVELSESVARGFRLETRNALRTEKEEPDAPSKFKLMEHSIDYVGTIDDVELESPGVAVTFKKVFGDNKVANITQYATSLAPFLSENMTKGRMVVARVTHVHSFAQCY